MRYKHSSLLVAFGILGIFSAAQSKVLIFTWVYNRPDFIQLQTQTFKAFLKDDYEYIVFNDAPDSAMQQAIENMCKELNVHCVRVPQILHQKYGNEPGQRHVHGIQFAFKKYGFDHNGIVLMIDADAFLIKPFSAEEYLAGYDLIGGIQIRNGKHGEIIYIAPTVVLLDMRTLPNKKTIAFDGGDVKGALCDTGGHMHYYIKNNPRARVKFFLANTSDNYPQDSAALYDLGFSEPAVNFIMSKPRYGFEFHAEGNFVHYYAGGSNWCGCSEKILREKDRNLYALIGNSMAHYNVQGHLNTHP